MKILLATTSQFGYLVDYHRYYTYLKNKGHEVKYISMDFGREKLEKGNPDIVYISGKGNKLLRRIKFINGIRKIEREYKFDRIMIHVFPGITSLLTSIPKKKLFLDVRTVSIHRKKYKRDFFDFLIKKASDLFQHTSAITDFTARQIGIRDYKLLPLGGAYFGNITSNGDVKRGTQENILQWRFYFYVCGNAQ